MFDFLVLQPLTNLLLLFYYIFGSNLGLSLLFLVIVFRLITLPLNINQFKIQKRLQDLQPKLAEMQLSKKDPNKISPEELALMREVSTSCLGLIIPFFIQIPLLAGLYHVINQIATVNNDPSINGDVFNNLLYFDFLKHDSFYIFNTYFMNIDLSRSFSSLNYASTESLNYILLLILLFLSQFVISYYTFFQNQNKKNISKNQPNKKRLTEEEKQKLILQKNVEKMNKIQVLYVLPLAITMTAYYLPAALGLYWAINNFFSFLQMFIQYRHMEGKLNKNAFIEDINNIKNFITRRFF